MPIARVLLVAFVVVGNLDLRAASPGAEPASFYGAGTMATARSGHAATLLADGRVLLVGGYGSGSTLAASEVYEPATGLFTMIASLGHARAGHSATLLADGRVLIVGGAGDRGRLARSEIYDPRTGSFSESGDLADARYGHTATLLRSGQVLIVAGEANTTNPAPELYDPDRGTFSATGPLNVLRDWGTTATLLADGRVLIVGGQGEVGSPAAPSKAAEVYDPATRTFSRTGSLLEARSNHAAALLPDGKVLVSGGFGVGYAILASTEIYDPSTGTFSPGGPLAAPRTCHTATALAGGNILIAGGLGIANDFDVMASVEIYDTATASCSTVGVLSYARQWHTATLLPNGKVVLIGGEDKGRRMIGLAEVFDPGPTPKRRRAVRR